MKDLAPVANRFAAAILGGYAFTLGFVAVTMLATFAAGLRFFEAQGLAWMLGVIVYVGAVMWGFATRSVARAWAVLGGGGLAMAASAWVVSRLLVT